MMMVIILMNKTVPWTFNVYNFIFYLKKKTAVSVSKLLYHNLKPDAKTVHRAFTTFCCCSPFARPRTRLHLCPFAPQNEGTTGRIYNSCHVTFFKCSVWECCDCVQSNQQMIIVSFYRINFLIKQQDWSILGNANFWNYQHIYVLYKAVHTAHDMHAPVHQADLSLCISKNRLRPSSQQGQGTFILIYSKGRLSFNFLHIHKRVSHPRSHFPFQP